MMQINIRKIFASKNPKLAKLLPGFIFRYIEHVIHQEELNNFLLQHGDKTGIPFLNAALDYFNVSVALRGLENIPASGRYLFASNHPLGGFDGIILMKKISEHFGDVRIIVNDILMNIENLEPLFLPINKHGSQVKDTVSAMDTAFASNIPIVTFPAGLCSRKIHGRIIDLEWKKNFIRKSLESKRNIVPVHFSGRNSNFFYNLSNLRKKIGIRSNIEMFYLVDELFKHRNGNFVITFGKPVDYTLFVDKKHSPQEWAAVLRNYAYQLDQNPDAILISENNKK
jgi:1-acyl-sn-glycerol-3-phosphate acyltransferase